MEDTKWQRVDISYTGISVKKNWAVERNSAIGSKTLIMERRLSEITQTSHYSFVRENTYYSKCFPCFGPIFSGFILKESNQCVVSLQQFIIIRLKSNTVKTIQSLLTFYQFKERLQLVLFLPLALSILIISPNSCQSIIVSSGGLKQHKSTKYTGCFIFLCVTNLAQTMLTCWSA